MRWGALTTLVVAAAMLVGGCGDELGVGGSGTSEDPAATAMSGRQLARLDVPGARHPVVLTREDHPRGGYQLHLYVDLGHGPRELTDFDHNPVIPFVATDTHPATAVSAHCTADGFAVTVAEPTTSSGAWDVHRTRYQVDGDQAVPLDRVELGANVPEAQLRSELPALFTQAMFTDCRA